MSTANVVFNGAMLYGLTLVLHPRFDAAEILASIQLHKATMFEGVPTMYMYMLAHPELARFDISSLTRCTVGGQTMPKAKMEEVERRFGCPLIELLGHDGACRPRHHFPFETVRTSSARSALRSRMSRPASPTSTSHARPCRAARSGN